MEETKQPTLLTFAEAFEALKRGKKIKRQHWKGYWSLMPMLGEKVAPGLYYSKDRASSTIVMHGKDGNDTTFQHCDVMFTIGNMLENDWVVVEDESVLDDVKVHTFTFGEAIRKLKQGRKVARKGWNGKDMYIWLQEAVLVSKDSSYGRNLKVEEILDHEHSSFVFQSPCICMKLVQKDALGPVYQPGWLASQADMLSEDWYEVI